MPPRFLEMKKYEKPTAKPSIWMVPRIYTSFSKGKFTSGKKVRQSMSVNVIPQSQPHPMPALGRVHQHHLRSRRRAVTAAHAQSAWLRMGF